MKLKNIVTAVLMLLATIAAMAQSPLIPIDRAVRMGKLPNGLTYYVRHNDYPENRVNFYIAQRVGSIQEEESQRGLAHFLEHMAFNGTVNYPGNGVIDYTRTLGVGFGRDLNAYTSVDQTVYNINDVPSTRVSALDSCLLILKDWSNGLLLEDEEIDKERGVIHEEWRLRSSAMQRILERNLETLYPGSKYGKRMPIGLMDVIDNFKYNEIRDYYHKWYRPDNQAIIVVGDVDVDRTEAKIKEMFGAIPAPAADAAQVVDEPVPDNENMIVVVDKDKEQQYSTIEVMFKHDATPLEAKVTQDYFRDAYTVGKAVWMLNDRLSEKAQEPDCPFLGASCTDEHYIYAKTKEAFTVSVTPKPGMSEQALKAAVIEVKRAMQHGFTASEYQRTREEYMSQLEDTYRERDKVTNGYYGSSCVAHYLSNEPMPSIEDDCAIMRNIAMSVEVEDVNKVLPRLVSMGDKNVVIMSSNQEVDGAVYPTSESLIAAVNEARNAYVAPHEDKVKEGPIIAQLPRAGKIVGEKKNKLLGYTELTLSNGVKVILKKTNYKKNEILMLAESRGGASLYDKDDWANIAVFEDAVASSGLGEFDNTELEKALAGKQASAGWSLSTSYESLSGASTVKDLETMFQLTYLQFTDVRKDEKSFNNLMNQIEAVLKNKYLDPDAVYSDSISVIMNNHSWRMQPFKVEHLREVSYDRVLQIVKERSANAADFTFYFVGNFDNKKMRRYLCQYIATLPSLNRVSENYKNVTERPVKDVVSQFSRKMETPKANARMYWFTLTHEPYSEERSVQVNIAGELLDKMYLRHIREDEGAAYSVGASGGTSFMGDRSYTSLAADCPVKPEKLDVAVSIMREEMQNLTSNVDEGSLNEIKELLLKDYATSVKENDYWLDVLNFYVDRGVDVHSNYPAVVEAQTAESIKAFVKDFLNRCCHVEIIMSPEE